MVGTKEFYELMEQFEKDVKKVMYGHKIERVSKEEKVPADVFYQDGYVNTLFMMYMYGYQSGKYIERAV